MSPAPLTPAECDISGVDFLPFDVHYWRNGSLAIAGCAESFRAAMLLCFASWHQHPCASLPDDDVVLSVLSGLGRTKRALNQWLKIKNDVLQDWKLCSDRRWYHPQISKQAVIAWRAKQHKSNQRKGASQRALKVREESKKIRNALVSVGVETRSVQPLNQLRLLAAKHGLTELKRSDEIYKTDVSGSDTRAMACGDNRETTSVSKVKELVSKKANQPEPDSHTLSLFPSSEKGETVLSTPKRADSLPLDYEAFVQVYHEAMPNNPRIVILSESRKKLIRQVWRKASRLEVAPFHKYKTRQEGIDAWRKFFQVCNASAFLRGEAPPGLNGRQFCPTLEFFLKIDNVIKCLEYRYHADNE